MSNRTKGVLLTLTLIFLLGCFNSPPPDITTVDFACRNNDTNFFQKHEEVIDSQFKTKRPGGFTYPLLLAGQYGAYELVGYLLDKGANIQVTNSSGQTLLMAIMQADKEPSTNLINSLVDLRINVNNQDSDGLSALHFAVQYKGTNVVKSLLLRNANPNIQDINGNTPLHMVSSKSKALILIQHGARPNITNRAGSTPLAYIRNNNLKLYEDLTAIGFDPGLENKVSP